MEKKLYVGNLSYNLGEQELNQAFSAFGTVVSAKVIMDRDTGRPKGFAFVEMSTEAEAQAAIDRIDSQVRMHLCERLESMLPTSIAAAEVASIKGELLLSKVVGKSSLSLDGIARSFTKTVRARAWECRSGSGTAEDALPVAEDQMVPLSEDQQQMAATMIHQSEVAHVAIDVSGDLLWLLSAGQWPDK